MIWAVLPVKGLDGAKQRLRAVLSARQRRDLSRAMVEDVLEALAAVETLDGIAVVTRDPTLAALGQRYGARIIVERESRGQTAAVTEAAKALRAEMADGVIAVPGDVPLANPTEIERVLAVHAAAPCPSMTIVPARDERGSNCVVCSPPDALPFQFGADSFIRHLDAARERGVTSRALHLPGLGLDIDTPADLAALLDRPGSARAQAYLKVSGIAAGVAGLIGMRTGQQGA